MGSEDNGDIQRGYLASEHQLLWENGAVWVRHGEDSTEMETRRVAQKMLWQAAGGAEDGGADNGLPQESGTGANPASDGNTNGTGSTGSDPNFGDYGLGDVGNSGGRDPDSGRTRNSNRVTIGGEGGPQVLRQSPRSTSRRMQNI